MAAKPKAEKANGKITDSFKKTPAKKKRGKKAEPSDTESSDGESSCAGHGSDDDE